jgi:maltose O-acetyltransferase
MRRIVEKFEQAWSVARVLIANHLIFMLGRGLRMVWYRMAMDFAIGEGSVILADCRVSEPSKLGIGKNTIVGNSCRFDNRQRIVIGDNVTISYGTVILTLGHDIDSSDFTLKRGDVRINNYVWLCAKCMVMPGVRIGEGAVVLPGSVVVHDVEPFSVVGGVPARFLRKRNRNLEYHPTLSLPVSPLD